MSNPSSKPASSRDIRLKMMRRSPARPGRIEKAQNPRQALIRLVVYLRPYRKELLFVLLLVVIYTVLALIGPYLMGVAIDNFIATKNPSGLTRIAVFMLIVYLTGAGFEAFSNWMMARISQGSLQRLRSDLFEHLQNLSLSFF